MTPEVLLVEDNPFNLKLARVMLEAAGHDVVEATTADEAQQRLDDGHPDLVLLDVQLPGKDGIQLVKELRDDPGTQDLVVVAVTAYAMRGDRERLLSAGFDGYLSKPLDPDTFAESVDAYLRQGRKPEV